MLTKSIKYFITWKKAAYYAIETSDMCSQTHTGNTLEMMIILRGIIQKIKRTTHTHTHGCFKPQAGRFLETEPPPQPP